MDLQNFNFSKKFGQNFIFDTNLLNAIVADSGVTKDDEVLEIGAGAGTLTKIIASKAKRVVSYEIDNNLKDILSQNLQGIENSQVIFADALKTPTSEIESNFSGDYHIIANLPYYITTPLIFKFIETTQKVKSITVMVQKEVADRLVAKSGKDYGIITIMLDFFGNVNQTRFVSRKMFTPMPNVDSAVVNIQIVKDKYKADKETFSKLVHSSFAMRRKTILNNLSSGLNLSKENVTLILEKANINPNARAEQLSTLDYVNLSNIYFDFIRHN